MSKVKYTLTATVPVAQYANLQPAIEVEADSIEDAESQVLPYIEKFYNKYSEKSKIGAAKVATKKGRKLETDLFGNEIFYDDDKHEYSNPMGEVYLSASQYADDDDFDPEYWANYFVEKYELEESDKQVIQDMWDLNGSTSANYGTAIHEAIELYGKYSRIADKIDVDLKTGERKKLTAKIDKNSALSKLPYLKKIVEDFFNEERKAEKAKYEVLVVDHKNKRAGRIDRLIRLDNGKFQIRDMKTNYKILKPEREKYAKQLSFYADIIEANGGEMGEKPLVLHHLTNGKWKDIELERVKTL